MKLDLQLSHGENKIDLSCFDAATTFVSFYIPPKLSLIEFKKNLDNLKKNCRALKVRFYGERANDFFEFYLSYSEEYQKAKELFDAAKQKTIELYAEGLEAPTVNNPRLKEIREINHKFVPLFNRSSIISQMGELYSRVSRGISDMHGIKSFRV